MATTLTFSSASRGNQTVDAIPGTYKKFQKNDERGATDGIPAVIAGEGEDGECQVLITDDGANNTLTIAEAIAMRSGIGEGDYTVNDGSDDISFHAVVMVDITGTAVMVAKIKWLGSKNF